MTQEEKKRAQQYFSLQPSEMAVFKCASQIFAAYICSGKVTDENKGDYYRIAIRDAMRIGVIVEKSIESDDELPASKGKSGVF
ncbi:MAG: hypothetical protein ACYS1A_11315 [Planctomycetota bacterium]|jgi:hypothetical protein